MTMVCIVNSGPEYKYMFESEGWEVTDYIQAADLVQFTGGEDVHPSWYDQTKHPKTHCNF
jgi:gamma-glutamyl-gamma-aminobutyrate hydrolase PuuD